MRRKIPKKLLLGSVVVCFLVTGCETAPSIDQPMPRNGQASQDTDPSSEPTTTSESLETDPIKRIQQLEQQNNALKGELYGLNTQLDTLIQLEKKNPQNKELKGQIDSLSKQKIALEEQVKARTKQLCELRKMLGDKTCPSP